MNWVRASRCDAERSGDAIALSLDAAATELVDRDHLHLGAPSVIIEMSSACELTPALRKMAPS